MLHTQWKSGLLFLLRPPYSIREVLLRGPASHMHWDWPCRSVEPSLRSPRSVAILMPGVLVVGPSVWWWGGAIPGSLCWRCGISPCLSTLSLSQHVVFVSVGGGPFRGGVSRALMAGGDYRLDSRRPSAKNLLECHPLELPQQSASEWEELIVEWQTKGPVHVNGYPRHWARDPGLEWRRSR